VLAGIPEKLSADQPVVSAEGELAAAGKETGGRRDLGARTSRTPFRPNLSSASLRILLPDDRRAQ